jgi:hypothetical protein
VEQQREGEAGGEHAEAADQRGSLVPADPHGCEPDQAGEEGQVTDPPRPVAEGGDQAGRHQAESGRDGERGGQPGVSGVGGEPAGALRDGQGAQADGERGRPGGQPRQVRPLKQDRRHRAIVACRGRAGPCWLQSDCGVSHDVPGSAAS